MQRTAVKLVVVLWAGVGCSSGSSYGSVSGGAGTGRGHSATTGAASGTVGSSSTSSSTSSSGTTGAGTSSTSGAACGPPITTLTDCDGGIEIRGTVFDYFLGTRIQGTPLQFQDVNNPGQVAETDGCGNIKICVPDAGQVVSLSVSVPGYLPGYLEDVQAYKSIYYQQVSLFLVNVLGGGSSLTSGLSTPVSLGNAGTVLVQINTVGNDAGCATDGWTFSATDLDGGPVSFDAGYLSGLQFVSNGPTAHAGIALLYGIDPAVGEVIVTGVRDAPGCMDVEHAFEFTGSVRVGAGYLSDLIYPVQ